MITGVLTVAITPNLGFVSRPEIEVQAAGSVPPFFVLENNPVNRLNGRGFTLIELMIAVAIIAILAAIAMISYQNFTIRSQVNSGLADIRSAQSGFESAISARGLTNFTLDDIGLPTETARCRPIDLTPGEDGSIRCTLVGHPAIRSATITLSRSSTTGWQCNLSGIEARYHPNGCN